VTRLSTLLADEYRPLAYDRVKDAVLQVIAELFGNVARQSDGARALQVVCHLRDRIRIDVAHFSQPRTCGTAPMVDCAGNDEDEQRAHALVQFVSMKAGDFPDERGLSRHFEIALAP